eukprot:m.95198 g.95198  ORF g.95198 m.95198 type:complete len:87 (+) comp36836_c0_seq7:60-320(+)
MIEPIRKMQTVEYQPTSIPRSLTVGTVLACVTALAVLVTFILSFVNAGDYVFYPIIGLPTYIALTTVFTACGLTVMTHLSSHLSSH